jgi:PAS domain S-box-containing protein
MKKTIQYYATLLEYSPFPAVIFRVSDLKIIALNTRAADLFRILKEKAISKPILDFFVCPDDLHDIMSYLNHHEKLVDYETRLLARGGRFFWAYLSANPISILEEKAVICGFTDINHQKELEQTLQKNKELYRSIIRTSPDNITMVDMLGKIFMVSPAAVRMFGYNDKDRSPYGMPILDHIHPADRARFKHDVRQLKAGTNTGVHEYRAVRKDGSELYIESHSEIINDNQGRPDSILYIIRDITQRKETEKAIRENEERFVTIFQEVPDPVLIFRQDGTILDMNRQCEEWFDVGKICSLGHKVQNLGFFSTDANNEDQFLKILSLQPGEKYETCIRLADGQERYAILSTRYITIQGDIAILLLINDIDSLTRAYKALTKANHQIGLLNSITRHDILNKVMVITGYGEILLEEYPDAEWRTTMQTIFSSGKDIQHLIDFTREYQDLGVHEPVWQRIDEILQKDVLKSLTGGVSLTIPIEKVEIYADPLFEKVLYNLIENSIRHGEGVTRIALSYEISGDVCRVVYCDDGVGVAESEKGLIFQKGHGKNTGLGLFLIREILSFTGISITENGVPGQGVRFEMLVPFGCWRYRDSCFMRRSPPPAPDR